MLNEHLHACTLSKRVSKSEDVIRKYCEMGRYLRPKKCSDCSRYMSVSLKKLPDLLKKGYAPER